MAATFQPIPYPPNSSPIKSISFQFREKDVVGDHVKGFTEVQIDHFEHITQNNSANKLRKQS